MQRLVVIINSAHTKQVFSFEIILCDKTHGDRAPAKAGGVSFVSSLAATVNCSEPATLHREVAILPSENISEGKKLHARPQVAPAVT